MKKIILAVLAAAAFFTSVAFAQTATTSPQIEAILSQIKLLRELEQGMTGDDVKMLQAILATQPDIYPEGILSGYFGPLTKNAVRKYQEKFGISPVGRVGPITSKKLNEFIQFNLSSNIVTTSTGTAATSTVPGLGFGQLKKMAVSSQVCVKVPPGHLVSPGWAKKNGGYPQAPACQPLPPGIAQKVELIRGIIGTATSTNNNPGTSTPTPTPTITPTPSPTSTTTADVTAPIISNISALNLRATSTQILWVTNESATTKLVYSTSTPVLNSVASTTVTVGGMSFTHLVTLNNLTASTTYYYVIWAKDNAGNSATSSEMSIMTPGM